VSNLAEIRRTVIEGFLELKISDPIFWCQAGRISVIPAGCGATLISFPIQEYFNVILPYLVHDEHSSFYLGSLGLQFS